MRFILFAIVAYAAYLFYNQSKQDDSADSAYANTLSPQQQDLVNQGRTNLESIISGIRRDHRTNTLRGNTSYQKTLTSDDTHLFNNVLIIPILPNSPLGWQKVGQDSYKYTFGSGTDEYVIFQYNNASGEISCISNIKECMLFE